MARWYKMLGAKRNNKKVRTPWRADSCQDGMVRMHAAVAHSFIIHLFAHIARRNQVQQGTTYLLIANAKNSVTILTDPRSVISLFDAVAVVAWETIAHGSVK